MKIAFHTPACTGVSVAQGLAMAQARLRCPPRCQLHLQSPDSDCLPRPCRAEPRSRMGPGHFAEIHSLLCGGMCQELGAALGERGAARVMKPP